MQPPHAVAARGTHVLSWVAEEFDYAQRRELPRGHSKSFVFTQRPPLARESRNGSSRNIV